VNIHDIHQGVQKRKGKKRVGRGIGSGHGKTASRGHKGQYASAGAEMFSPVYEGGQMRFYVRMPKRGFSNGMFQKQYLVVNIGDINAAFNDGDVVDRESLRAKGLANGPTDGVRILGTGEVTKRLTVRANHISESAEQKLKAAGGTVEKIAAPKPPTRNKMGTARKAVETLASEREARRAARVAAATQQAQATAKKAPKKKK
jgi:large subunit ribosomal protein L15